MAGIPLDRDTSDDEAQRPNLGAAHGEPVYGEDSEPSDSEKMDMLYAQEAGSDDEIRDNQPYDERA